MEIAQHMRRAIQNIILIGLSQRETEGGRGGGKGGASFRTEAKVPRRKGGSEACSPHVGWGAQHTPDQLVICHAGSIPPTRSAASP